MSKSKYEEHSVTNFLTLINIHPNWSVSGSEGTSVYRDTLKSDLTYVVL